MASQVLEKVRVERPAGALGALVYGLNLSELTPAVSAQARELIIEHHVVSFRGQDLPPRKQQAFAESLGELYYHPAVNGLAEAPGLIEVFNTLRGLECFHQDSTHSTRPPRFSILAARILPPFGGDTLFANQLLAFEALSPRLQELLSGLRAVHKSGEIKKDAEGFQNYSAYQSANEVAVHPVVRTHPDTGRKGLYVNAMYTKHFEGMTEEESAPLLSYIYQHVVHPHFTYRHRWQPGDVTVWDNASVQHAVIADMPEGAKRYMHRATTMDKDPPR